MNSNDLLAAMPQTCYELGAAMGYIKYAHDQHPQIRDLLLSRLSPAHQMLVAEYQAAASDAN